jgi:hypothetical protein
VSRRWSEHSLARIARIVVGAALAGAVFASMQYWLQWLDTPGPDVGRSGAGFYIARPVGLGLLFFCPVALVVVWIGTWIALKIGGAGHAFLGSMLVGLGFVVVLALVSGVLGKWLSIPGAMAPVLFGALCAGYLAVRRINFGTPPGDAEPEQ